VALKTPKIKNQIKSSMGGQIRIHIYIYIFNQPISTKPSSFKTKHRLRAVVRLVNDWTVKDERNFSNMSP